MEHYKDAIDENTIVSKTDTRGVITYANEQFIAISGYTKNELLGKPHNIVRHPDNPASFFQEMWETLKDGRPWKGIVKNRSKNGSSYYVKTVIMPLLDENERIQEYIAIRYDVSELLSKLNIFAKTSSSNYQAVKFCSKPLTRPKILIWRLSIFVISVTSTPFTDNCLEISIYVILPVK